KPPSATGQEPLAKWRNFFVHFNSKKIMLVRRINWLRIILLFFLALYHFSLRAQPNRQFVMLDMLDSAFQVNNYTLNTRELYGTDHTLELYNVHIGAALVLFTVLPDFAGHESWERVDTATLKGTIVQYDSFHRAMLAKYSEFYNTQKSMNYALIKKEGEEFFVSRHCLFEYFNLREYPPVIHAPYGTVNIGQSPLSIREMREALGERDLRWLYPTDIRNHGLLSDQPMIRREYLSRILEINGEMAYQFWSFTDWNVSDGFNYHRGADRFIYLPGKGIIGGSYDFYFYFRAKLDFTPRSARYTISMDEWFQNILDEKVMLAEELKDTNSEGVQIP
ncbi:MAG TPA: hypothetical protein VKZ78_04480, partial [Sphingobacteriaceae bacterium]|nr:hypothetical protein [Sphingobacteriaceae bacterium]